MRQKLALLRPRSCQQNFVFFSNNCIIGNLANENLKLTHKKNDAVCRQIISSRTLTMSANCQFQNAVIQTSAKYSPI